MSCLLPAFIKLQKAERFVNGEKIYICTANNMSVCLYLRMHVYVCSAYVFALNMSVICVTTYIYNKLVCVRHLCMHLCL